MASRSLLPCTSAGRGPGPELRALLELIPEAALWCQDGRVLAVNRRARALFGPRRRLVGRRLEGLGRRREAEAGLREIRIVQGSQGAGVPVEVQRAPCRIGGQEGELVLLRDLRSEFALLRELREKDDWLADMATLASDWFWETDAEHRYVWFSENVERVLGIPRRWFYGKRRADILGPDNDPATLERHFAQIQRHEPYRDFEFQILGPEGPLWVRSNGRPLFDERGRFRGYRGTGRDITAFKRAERARRESEERYRQLVELLPDGVVMHREGVIIFANARVAEMLGWARAEDLLGLHVLDLVHPEDRPQVVARWREIERLGRVPPAELRLRRRDRGIVHVETRAARVSGANGAAVLVTARDIGERKAAERRLAWLAHHDSLTGLPNRRFLAARLAELSATRRAFALLLLDLDGFKQINDTLGHSLGDRLLLAVGERLRGLVRPGDTVCRMGGDEFAVIAPDIRTQADALMLAERLRTAISRGFEVGEGDLRLGVTIGLALFPHHAETAEQVLARADLALYAAMRERHGEPVVYHPALLAEAEAQRRIERDLRAHLDAAALEVHYQPAVRLRDGAVVGVEALVRWPAGAGERVSPERFVRVAEERGLAARLTEHVLRQVARDFPRLHSALGCPLRLAINLSPGELALCGAADRLVRLVRDLGLDPTALEFEITERTLLVDAETVADNLRRLGEAGIRFAMDDFGTGYSSLVYLKRFPFDRLKLDRTFVRGLPEDGENRAIVAAVLSLARNLGLEVLAEGVETEVQRSYLRGLGCHEAQGYLFAPPLPPEDLIRRMGRALLQVGA